MIPGVTTRNVSREALVLRVGQLVERLPGDEHRHDDGLARAGRHLERDPVEPGVAGLAFSSRRCVLDPGLAVAGDLGEEDRGLERLDLAEEERLLAVRRRASSVSSSRVTAVTPG